MDAAVARHPGTGSDFLIALTGAALVHLAAALLVVTTLALPGRDLEAPGVPREQIIEAEVIDARVLEAEARRLREAEAAARREREEAAAAAAAERQAAERERIEMVRIAAEKEAAERRLREAAVAKAKAEAAKEKREAAAQLQREKEAKALLAAEERRRKAALSGAEAAYHMALVQKVQRNWLKPALLPPDLECLVRVEQLPTGDVIRATVVSCNGDGVVRRSIEDAVLKASPLPQPSDRALYSRVVEFNFKPNR